MIIRLCLYQAGARGIGNSLISSNNNQLINRGHQILNRLPKRWSGHNAMTVTPSNFPYQKFKDKVHFFSIIALVPCFVISTITGIRGNPELREIPEGYEPRHWEYYRHPITRFMAKYMFAPPDYDHECWLAVFENASETKILSNIEKDVDTNMSFYNDHRSKYFEPYYAEVHRLGRDFMPFIKNLLITNEGHHYDYAHSPVTPVPVEGYKPESMLESSGESVLESNPGSID